ncbi:MAG: NUDIX domain-containing protein [Geodermatophilaceae bacterium]|nr:NUDIX domain-containing protein [Geodermatophilaceae bacterium]
MLLARASVGPARMWYLPGGGLDFGEHPQVGALRELREETGYIGELDALLGVEVLRLADPDGIAWELVWIIYRARVTGGKLTPEADGSTDFAAWVNPERLTTVNTGQLVERALALPLHGGSPVPPYDGLAATGRSELRGVTRLVASGTAAATDESARRVAHGSTVRPGEDPAAAVVRAWAALGTDVTVGPARCVTSDIVDDPAAGVRRWTVRVLYDVDIS